MNDHLTYVPILRWKGAERLAIRKLDTPIKQHIMPLLEFVPKEFKGKSTSSVFRNKAVEITKTLGWKNRAFIDPWLLPDDLAVEGLPIFAERISGFDFPFALVTGPFRSAAYQEAVKLALTRSNAELCLRVLTHDFRQGHLQSQIRELLQTLKRNPSQVHLVLDLQHVDEFAPEIGQCVKSLPFTDEWLSFTVAAGAFPKDLSGLSVGRHLLSRTDWLRWREYVSSTKGRKPCFADYTIQHGSFEEHEGKHFNFSASIRYTAYNDWIVMRGEGVQNEGGPGYSQWPANAQMVCLEEQFCGPAYSYGDSYINEMGQQMMKTGGAKEWLAAGINHHLTHAVRQILEMFSVAEQSEPSRG